MKKRTELLNYTVLYTLLTDHRGRENAVHSCVLERHFNISESTLKRIIRHLRISEHHPICSCSEGYYYPNTKDEIIETFSRIYSGAASCMTVCDSLMFHDQDLGSLKLFGGYDDEELPFS